MIALTVPSGYSTVRFGVTLTAGSVLCQRRVLTSTTPVKSRSSRQRSPALVISAQVAHGTGRVRPPGLIAERCRREW